MSSGPARYEVSGERRNPKPSCRTSRVPSPKIASPFLAWLFSRAKMSSCLRRRLAPSSSAVLAVSTSSWTCLSLRSDRCITRSYEGGFWDGPGDVTGRNCGERLDVAVDEGCELGLGQGAHLGGFDRAVLEEHERRDPADAVLGRRGLVLVDVELGDLEAARVLGGDLVEGGRDHLAGPAPLGPVVDQHRGL